MPKRKRGSNLHDKKHVRKRAQRAEACRKSLCPSAIHNFPVKHKLPRLAVIARKGNVCYLSELTRGSNEGEDTGNGDGNRVITEAFVILDDDKTILPYYDPHAITQEGIDEMMRDCGILWRDGKDCIERGITMNPPGQKMRLYGYTCSLDPHRKLACRVVNDKNEDMRESGHRMALKATNDLSALIGPVRYLLPQVPVQASPYSIACGKATTMTLTKNYESHSHRDTDGGGSAAICWLLSGRGKRPLGGNFVLPELGLEFKTYHGAAIMFDTSRFWHYTQRPVPVEGGPDLWGFSVYLEDEVLRTGQDRYRSST
ncbi:hypothetical protein COCOBI_02-2510 [Coccomyxa sp. Obi]|nr:hypothetical protein COCOBI_02-2510 [Coccomyxa sp. Obi]